MKRYNIKNILNYFAGNLRYTVYYTKLKFILREHIREQISHRIRLMKPECYNTGACTECGCTTTALQMANKTCGGVCYPTMFSKKEWKLLKEGWSAWKDDKRWVIKNRILIKEL